MLSRSDRAEILHQVEAACPEVLPLVKKLVLDTDEVLGHQETRLRILRDSLAPADETENTSTRVVSLLMPPWEFRRLLARFISLAERERA